MVLDDGNKRGNILFSEFIQEVRSLQPDNRVFRFFPDVGNEGDGAGAEKLQVSKERIKISNLAIHV